jgi:hypothetical protein
MSATELIKKVADLPSQERKLFEQLFQAMLDGNGAISPTRQIKWPDFGERLHSIYGEKVAPDSQQIIDEGRGTR